MIDNKNVDYKESQKGYELVLIALFELNIIDYQIIN